MLAFKDHDNCWLPCMMSFDESNTTLGLSPSFYFWPRPGLAFWEACSHRFLTWTHVALLMRLLIFCVSILPSLSGAWILDLHNKKKVKKGQRNCSILIFRYGYCRKLSDYSHRQSMHRRLGTAHEGSKPTISLGGRLALPIEHRKGGFGKHVGAKVRPETQKGSILLLGECNFLCHWCINVDTNYSSSDWIPLWFPYKKSVKPAMNLGFYIQAHIAL